MPNQASLLLVLLGDLAEMRAGVAPMHRAIGIQHFAEDEHVVFAMERIGDDLGPGEAADH